MGEKKRRLAANLSKVSADSSADSSAVSSVNSSGSANLAHARQLLQQGLLIDAINLYQQVLRQNTASHSLAAPLHAEALHFQGLALLQTGQRSIGISLMQQALKVDAGNPIFHLNCGLALAEQDSQAALPYLQAACQLAPDDAAMALSLAECHIAAGQSGQAIAVLKNAPQVSANADLLAQLYYAQNQLPLALASFEQALALNPGLSRQRLIGYARAQGPGRVETSLPEANSAELAEYLRQLDLHIIDDFLPDPDSYRQQALTQTFHQTRYAGQNYPGRQTDGQACQTIMQALADQLGKTIKFISPDNGSYRISFADSTARTDIHVDNESGDAFATYAAVLYLNLPQQCQGGTQFWQHTPSNWVGRPPDQQVRAAGYANFKSFQQRHLPRQEQGVMFNQLSQMHQQWRQVLEVPMRQNRLILYRGDFFHSIGQVFGHSMEDGRLVQLFFFDVVQGPEPEPKDRLVDTPS
jgi:tetratricopeptide (TPR) repeat protein